jgi:hypothetical protein
MSDIAILQQLPRGQTVCQSAALDCCLLKSVSLMTKDEKKRLSAVLRATEYLFLENIALKLVLEHRQVANWQKLLDHLLSDKEMLAGVRLKFSDLYREIEGSADPSSALEAFLGGLPAPKKTH